MWRRWSSRGASLPSGLARVRQDSSLETRGCPADQPPHLSAPQPQLPTPVSLYLCVVEQEGVVFLGPQNGRHCGSQQGAAGRHHLRLPHVLEQDVEQVPAPRHVTTSLLPPLLATADSLKRGGDGYAGPAHSDQRFQSRQGPQAVAGVGRSCQLAVDVQQQLPPERGTQRSLPCCSWRLGAAPETRGRV